MTARPLAVLAAVAASSAALAPTAHADVEMLIADGFGDRIVRFEYPSGAPIDHFVANGIDSLSRPGRMVVGPDGRLYVTSSGNSRVLGYDLATGQPEGIAVQQGEGGLNGAWDIAFLNADTMLVSSVNNDRIIAYDRVGSTGVWVDAGRFDAVDAALNGPYDLHLVGQRLFVADYHNDRVVELDAATGAYVGTAIPSDTPGMDGPIAIAEAPDGRLWITAENTDRVFAFDPDTGVTEIVLVDTGEGLDYPIGLAFDADGSVLVVCAGGDGRTLRYAQDGSFLGVAVPSYAGGLGHQPYGVLLVDRGEPSCSGDLDADGDVDFEDLINLLAAWGTCP